MALSLALASLLPAAPPDAGVGAGAPSSLPPPRHRARSWSSVKGWTYQLQHLDLAALARAPSDLLVIDYSKDGSDGKALTRAEVRRLQDSGKLVVSYLSIGEAEPYRYYWREGWGPGHPSWIQRPNPSWPDNFPVQYWHPEWQRILMHDGEGYLDRILAAGFDGVYLDIVDGYEAFQSRRPQAAQEMKQLVSKVAAYTRARAGDDFGVFAQNAVDLLEDPEYRAVLTGLGKEETYFFPGDEPNPHEDMLWEEDILGKLVEDGKLVLTVDYPSKPANRAWVAERARSRGFVPYLAGVELDHVEPQP